MNFFVGPSSQCCCPAHQLITWTASEWLLYCMLQVTPNTSANSYHKTKYLIHIKVRRWETLPIEHALYIDILYLILTNLFSLPFVVLQNVRNSSSIFFVFDLTSDDSVLANFSTTVIHTATQHKWYSQNIFNCTNPKAKFWKEVYFFGSGP